LDQIQAQLYKMLIQHTVLIGRAKYAEIHNGYVLRLILAG
jgi:hypothetical protein